MCAFVNSPRAQRLPIMKLSAPINKAHLPSLLPPSASLSLPNLSYPGLPLHLPLETLTSPTDRSLLSHRSAFSPQPRGGAASRDPQINKTEKDVEMWVKFLRGRGAVACDIRSASLLHLYGKRGRLQSPNVSMTCKLCSKYNNFNNSGLLISFPSRYCRKLQLYKAKTRNEERIFFWQPQSSICQTTEIAIWFELTSLILFVACLFSKL